MKLPVYLLHFWLPKAHVEAPTGARILLAGLLLKLGGIGLFRILGSLKLSLTWPVLVLGLLSCVFSPVICVLQSDSKRLAAYSSVVHINFLFLAIIIINPGGEASGVLMILFHGYFSSVIFYMIGDFYHKRGTRIIYYINSVT